MDISSGTVMTNIAIEHTPFKCLPIQNGDFSIVVAVD